MTLYSQLFSPEIPVLVWYTGVVNYQDDLGVLDFALTGTGVLWIISDQLREGQESDYIIMYYDPDSSSFLPVDDYSSGVSITADGDWPWTINSSGEVCHLTQVLPSTNWDCLSTDA